MKFVLATQNPKKLKEMSAILGELGVEVVSEADLGVKIEVEETGETFAENSLLKAKAVMEATKLPAIADDSGLCVNALNGGPGRPPRQLPHDDHLRVPERRRLAGRRRGRGHDRVRADGRKRLRLRSRVLRA